LEAAGHVRIAEREIRIEGEADQRAPVAHDHLTDGAAAGSSGAVLWDPIRESAIPEGESHARWFDRVLDASGEPAIRDSNARADPALGPSRLAAETFRGHGWMNRCIYTQCLSV